MFKIRLKVLLIGLIIGLLLIIQPYKLVVVVGDSMSPTFRSGQILLAKKVDKVNSGDIVVAYNDFNEKIIKRVVYMPDEYYYYHYVKHDDIPMLIRDNSYKNVLNWMHIYGDGMIVELKVPKGHYYLLGDNFNNSDDSRRFGTIERSQIIYKVIM